MDNGVQSVRRALAILAELNRKTDPQGVTALSVRLGLAKSTVHRLLATLTRAGVVVRHACGHYSAGPDFWPPESSGATKRPGARNRRDARTRGPEAVRLARGR